MTTQEKQLLSILGPDGLKSIGEDIAEIVRQHNLQNDPDTCKELFDYMANVVRGWGCNCGQLDTGGI